MRLTSLLSLSLLLACGGGGSEDTTGPTTSTTNGNSSTGAVDPTTGTIETSTPGSSTGTSGEPATSTSTGGPTTTTATSTTTTASTGTGDETGPVSADQCAQDADCKLFTDCCECRGVPVGDDPPSCDLACDQTFCDALGVDKAICQNGQCITERLGCNPADVTCNGIPPECPKGQVPGVEKMCWSGGCVPGEICDVVPDCKFCPDTWVCVTDVTLAPGFPRCEAMPAACMGEPDCACAGELVCDQGFMLCTDPGGNQINCECPNC